MIIPVKQAKPVTGTKVLIWVALFFAIVFTANIAFVYFAETSWTGLTTTTAYHDGIAFNNNLERAAKQKQRGWQSKIQTFTRKRLVVVFSDKQGNALTGLDVGVKVMRPLRETFDRVVRLKETAAGEYQSRLDLPLPGRWQLQVRAKDKRSDNKAEPYLLIYDLMIEK